MVLKRLLENNKKKKRNSKSLDLKGISIRLFSSVRRSITHGAYSIYFRSAMNCPPNPWTVTNSLLVIPACLRLFSSEQKVELLKKLSETCLLCDTTLDKD